MRSFLIAAAIPFLAFPAAGQETGADPSARAAESVEIAFVTADGGEAGTATLSPSTQGVLIAVDLRNLPPGWHGFHIHETGECDAAGGFESAGGHLTLADTEHGYFTETGPHAGDMPNIFVGEDGTARATIFNSFVRLAEDDPATLRGRAILVHADPDDYAGQPSGHAGDRLACAVVE